MIRAVKKVFPSKRTAKSNVACAQEFSQNNDTDMENLSINRRTRTVI